MKIVSRYRHQWLVLANSGSTQVTNTVSEKESKGTQIHWRGEGADGNLQSEIQNTLRMDTPEEFDTSYATD